MREGRERLAKSAVLAIALKKVTGTYGRFRLLPLREEAGRVWLQADLVDGKVVFQAESDALIVKGIISLLIQVVSGHTPDEILESDLYFIEKIGLKEHLSPTRSNGLLAMVKQMRMYALAFKAKMQEA